MVRKIISGGQTGADRAALDFAIKHNIPHGGWIPKGRKAEDGPLPGRYQLKEMPTVSYPKRTEQNVIDSDGTVIISHGRLTGGSAVTAGMARKHNRPWLHLDMEKFSVEQAAQILRSWIAKNKIKVFNVAGLRQPNDCTYATPSLRSCQRPFSKPLWLNPWTDQNIRMVRPVRCKPVGYL